MVGLLWAHESKHTLVIKENLPRDPSFQQNYCVHTTKYISNKPKKKKKSTRPNEIHHFIKRVILKKKKSYAHLRFKREKQNMDLDISNSKLFERYFDASCVLLMFLLSLKHIAFYGFCLKVRFCHTENRTKPRSKLLRGEDVVAKFRPHFFFFKGKYGILLWHNG